MQKGVVTCRRSELGGQGQVDSCPAHTPSAPGGHDSALPAVPRPAQGPS